MRRLYFVTGSVGTARKVTDRLLHERIPESDIHVLSSSKELPDNLPEATINEKSDFWPAIFKGLALGGLTGLVLGILLVLSGFISNELEAQTQFILLIAIVGALLGAFSGAIVGVSVPAPLMERFNKELDKGRLVIMIDVPDERTDEIRKLIKTTAPRTRYYGYEVLEPVFP